MANLNDILLEQIADTLDGVETIKGQKGERGPKGPPGKDGKDGVDGKDGDPGAPGRDGKDGKDGRDGVDGKRGPKGAKGDPGEPGKGGSGGGNVGVGGPSLKIWDGDRKLHMKDRFKIIGGNLSQDRHFTILDLSGLGGEGGSHPDLATHDALGLATDAELTAHAADTTSVHGIADTSVLETTTGSQTKVDTHVNDATAAHAASAIAFTPAGNLAADDVQEALAELDTEKAATGHTHTSVAFARGGTIVNLDGIANSALNVIVWRAPFACTVTNVRGYRVGGTGATINARLNGSSNHLSSALSLTNADTWMDGGAVQNTTYAAGDKMEIMVVSTAGTVTQLAIQVDATRTI